MNGGLSHGWSQCRGRVGIIGDVHGDDAALDAALRFLSTLGPMGALLCTGDVVEQFGSGDSDRCCRLLHEAGALTVCGNHDRWYLEAVGDPETPNADVRRLSPESERFVRNLPPILKFETPLGRLLLCHGIAKDDLSGVYPGGNDFDVEQALSKYGLPGPFRVMLSGHTHRRMVRPLSSGFTLLNAGTLQWAYDPCFAVLDLERAAVCFFDVAFPTCDITEAETLSLFR